MAIQASTGTQTKPIVIAGAGLAGLACAAELASRGSRVLLLEQGDHIGGRVWSDLVEGFILDRGFQVLLDSYPEARACLKYDELRLRGFAPGALIRTHEGFQHIVDPLRDPLHTLDTLRAGAFSLADMWRVIKLRLDSGSRLEQLMEACQSTTTRAFLRSRGFTARAVERFFCPFFSGVFLESELATPAEMFLFVFHMFSNGSACLPENGMRAIPEQLASRLPEDAIRLRAHVTEISRDGVRLADGSEVEAAAVVLATDYVTTAQLLGVELIDSPWRDTTTVYFNASKPPIDNSILVLNGTGSGIVNNLTVPSNVQRKYAPKDCALVCVSILGVRKESDRDLSSRVRDELGTWFGASVAKWRLLRTYRIAAALPVQFGTSAYKTLIDKAALQGIELAGDYLVNPSIEGAIRSGRQAAMAALEKKDKER